MFGFLINLPIVSYYEIGTAFTANHAHGAMMGVYGMLAIGFFMFIARHFIRPDRGSEWAMKLSFWGLNAGLALMLCANLIPMGGLQLYDAVRYGYWHARQPDFFQQPWSRVIEWFRMPGDLIFLFIGILPVVYLGFVCSPRGGAMRDFRPRPPAKSSPSGTRRHEPGCFQGVCRIARCFSAPGYLDRVGTFRGSCLTSQIPLLTIVFS